MKRIIVLVWRRIALLLWMLVVPLLTCFVALGMQQDMENQWVQAITKQYGSTAAARAPTLAKVCSLPETASQLNGACTDLHVMSWLMGAGLVAGLLGLILLASIALCGRLARIQRQLLVTVFSSGLRITSVAAICLIGLHAVLAMATIWYGESSATGQVHYQLVALIGLGAITGIAAMLKPTLSAVGAVTTKVRGQELDPQAHPDLWQFVNGLARQVGTAAPDHIVGGLLPTFFVTEANVEALDASFTGRTLYLSLPLCRILTRYELAAVIGHELSHFHGEDTAFSQRFYLIYRGAQQGILVLAANAGGWWRSIALKPAINLLLFFMESFARAESELSRARELVADQVGARVASTAAQGAALVKIHAFAGRWQQVMKDMEAGVDQRQRLENASVHYTHLVQEHATPDALRGLDEQRIPHPIDSHPPLSVRLESLGQTLDSCRPAALQLAAGEMSIALFTEPEALERELTERDNRWLAMRG